MNQPRPPFLPPASSRAARWVKGTAGKAFFILMLALLPLALATIVANWHSIQTAEEEKKELLVSATRQGASQLASRINTIHTALSLTANVLAEKQNSSGICQRLQSLFDAMTNNETGLLLAIFDRSDHMLCQSGNGASLLGAFHKAGRDAPKIMLTPDLGGLLIRSTSRDDSIVALALYQRPALRKLTSDERNNSDQIVFLHQGSTKLVLTPISASQDGQNRKLLSANATVHAIPKNSPLILTNQVTDSLATNTRLAPLLMPLLLWVAAVFLGWLVVHWLLIKPLTTLRREIAAYVPGKIIHSPTLSPLASNEIIELGDTFQVMSQEVVRHEQDLHEALERQTRLTREVHHRVKNNLQIISSLISLHWRAAPDASAGDAYLSIQRRVDALAVVQRNHYAELDEDQGLRARPMMNEIASALKISAKVQSGRNIEIAVDCDDVMLNQDVATAIAFMTAELADLVISFAPEQGFVISLIRSDKKSKQARFSLLSPMFRRTGAKDQETAKLYERVLAGLARQLRTPLIHDIQEGEYHINIPVIA